VIIFVIKLFLEFIITISFTGKNTAKVFSALSWSWSSKSLLVTKEAVDFCGSSEPCRPGAHCITLKKLYAAEQKLYKEVKVRSSLNNSVLVRMCVSSIRIWRHLTKRVIGLIGLAQCCVNLETL
jgi:hypothetical protein